VKKEKGPDGWMGLCRCNNYWFTKNEIYPTEHDALAAGNIFALPVFERDQDLVAGAELAQVNRFDIVTDAQGA